MVCDCCTQSTPPVSNQLDRSARKSLSQTVAAHNPCTPLINKTPRPRKQHTGLLPCLSMFTSKKHRTHTAHADARQTGCLIQSTHLMLQQHTAHVAHGGLLIALWEALAPVSCHTHTSTLAHLAQVHARQSPLQLSGHRQHSSLCRRENPYGSMSKSSMSSSNSGSNSGSKSKFGT